jgi:hypothetical protein
MLNLESTKFMSNEEIKSIAPSVFTTTSADNVSKHYTHIPTTKVIDDMRLLGWDVVDAKEVRARKSVGFQKHLVVFRNPEVVIDGVDGDTVFPQILLTNSHDGKNAFTFIAGLFRMICENGLVIATEQFEDVKMRHMGYTFEDLQKNIREMVARLPLTVESMNTMKQIELGEEQALEFAKKALETRFDELQMTRIKVDLKDLLAPTRREDKGSDLWSVFNVVQEKLLGGGFEYITGTKVRKARRVKNFKQDQKINQDLFSLALQYAN